MLKCSKNVRFVAFHFCLTSYIFLHLAQYPGKYVCTKCNIFFPEQSLKKKSSIEVSIRISGQKEEDTPIVVLFKEDVLTKVYLSGVIM